MIKSCTSRCLQSSNSLCYFDDQARQFGGCAFPGQNLRVIFKHMTCVLCRCCGMLVMLLEDCSKTVSRHRAQSKAGNSACFSQHCSMSSELTAASRQAFHIDTALHQLCLLTPILLSTTCHLANFSHVCLQELLQAQCLRVSQLPTCPISKNSGVLQLCTSMLCYYGIAVVVCCLAGLHAL